MTIEIHDAALEARLQQQMEAMGATTPAEALERLIDTQQEIDRWLLDNRELIGDKIRRGTEQLDRGEGALGDVAWERLQGRKSAWLQRNMGAKE